MDFGEHFYLTVLLMHVAAAMGLWSVLRGAPCWLQKLVLWILIVAFLVFIASIVLMLFGDMELGRELYVVAGAIEHIGVFVYVMRVWYTESDKKWRTSYRPSRQSAR